MSFEDLDRGARSDGWMPITPAIARMWAMEQQAGRKPGKQSKGRRLGALVVGLVRGLSQH